MPKLSDAQTAVCYVYDENGGNPKDRPVVAMFDSPIERATYCICITTSIAGNYKEHHVKLPTKYDHQSKTGLWEECAANCKWGARLSYGYPKAVIGSIDKKFYYDILKRLHKYGMEAEIFKKPSELVYHAEPLMPPPPIAGSSS